MEESHIISLLPPPFDDEVQKIRQFLKNEFQLGGWTDEPRSYFLWQVIEGWNEADSPLVRLAVNRMCDFKIRTVGLEAKTGDKPELFIPLVKSVTLQSYHDLISENWREVRKGSLPVIELDEWIPHIPLASTGLTPASVFAAVSWLSEQNLNWEITIDHLGVLRILDGKPDLFQKYRFLPGL